jgi:uncharacterized caspase-like protein
MSIETGGESSHKVVFTGGGHSVATLGTLVLCAAHSPPSGPEVAAILRAFDEQVEGDSKAAVYILVTSDTKPPNDASRQVMRRLFEGIGARGAGVAVCLEGTGFMAAAKRAVTTLAMMAQRVPSGVKIAATNQEAAAWLAERTGQRVPAARIAGSMDKLRAGLHAGA